MLARRGHAPCAVRCLIDIGFVVVCIVRLPRMPQSSQPAASLGTDNGFVVLAEVNVLSRAGEGVTLFCWAAG